MAAIGSGSNPVAILNTFYPKLPYVFRDPIGPPHNRVFFCSVTVEERVYSGHGSSKKAAKQAAAQEALKELHNMRLRLSYGSQCKRPWSFVSDRSVYIEITLFAHYLLTNVENE